MNSYLNSKLTLFLIIQHKKDTQFTPPNHLPNWIFPPSHTFEYLMVNRLQCLLNSNSTTVLFFFERESYSLKIVFHFFEKIFLCFFFIRTLTNLINYYFFFNTPHSLKIEQFSITGF